MADEHSLYDIVVIIHAKPNIILSLASILRVLILCFIINKHIYIEDCK